MELNKLNREELRALTGCLLAYDDAITYHAINDIPTIIHAGIEKSRVYLTLSNDVEISSFEYNKVEYLYFDGEATESMTFDDYPEALAMSVSSSLWNDFDKLPF